MTLTLDNVNDLLIVVCSFLLGFAVDLGYRWKIRGHKIPLPYIAVRARNATIFAAILGLISVGTVINVAAAEHASEQCNVEFREALAYNTDLTAQQRQLDEQEDALDAQVRRNLNEVLRAVASATSREDTIDAINRYNDAAVGIDRQFDQLDRTRIEINTARKPYPEPTCGRN
ncbi:membrane protein [Gordonia Phage Sampson]|uniref:Membrane protein n=2 Tax=Zitchvirus TaxID=2948963 RepID=A0A976UE44_9CAUD|nr:membrane protein [Gordonia Phage Sampson]UVG35008.1 membrane protein [Gordonia phage ViaConlectus]